MEAYFTELCKSNFTGNNIKLKAEFMQIFGDYPHYLALHNSHYHLKEYVRESQISPPVKLIVTMIKEAIYSYHEESDIHKACIDAITYILTKHDADAKYDEQQRKKIARIYFPLVSMVVKHFPKFSMLNERERREYLRCVIWILGNLDKEYLVSWLNSYITHNELTPLVSMVKIMNLATHTFGINEKKRPADINSLLIVRDLLVTLVCYLLQLIFINNATKTVIAKDILFSVDDNIEPSNPDLIGYLSDNSKAAGAIVSLESKSPVDDDSAEYNLSTEGDETDMTAYTGNNVVVLENALVSLCKILLNVHQGVTLTEEFYEVILFNFFIHNISI